MIFTPIYYNGLPSNLTGPMRSESDICITKASFVFHDLALPARTREKIQGPRALSMQSSERTSCTTGEGETIRRRKTKSCVGFGDANKEASKTTHNAGLKTCFPDYQVTCLSAIGKKTKLMRNGPRSSEASSAP